ncbi:MAG: SHOCT domain-containing protein [bacterium]|nr:SHOCT domain-containing protein [bacterium]
MMGYYNNFMGGFGLFGPIFMILFWGLIIWVIVRLIKGGGNHSGCCGHGGDDPGGGKALDILKERYAKGEIKKEEYEQKKKDLA